MILNRVWMVFTIVLCLAVLFAAPVNAADKVVVIPLFDTKPVEPFRPVATASPPDSAYTIGTDTVTDNVTGLVWQKEDDDTRLYWDDAWDYCAGNDAGLPGTGWRLPSVDELMSIVDYETHDPAINGTAFPGTNSSDYWSATTSSFESARAWYVDFSSGEVQESYKTYYRYVRCVRRGQ